MDKNDRQNGFTLIEIMIVIAIVGVLAAIAIPQFVSYRERAYCSAAETDARTVGAAVADYYSIGVRTSVPDVSELKLPSLAHQNIALIEGTDANTLIIVKVATTNRCPQDHQQAALRIDAESTGWDGLGNYYHAIK